LCSDSPETPPRAERKYFDLSDAPSYFAGQGVALTTYTLRRLIAEGELKYKKIGRRFYLSKQNIDAYLARTEGRAR
jgi:excisionase family DNA binding protein